MAYPAFKDVLADGRVAPSGADDSYKKATGIMQSLRYRLHLWKDKQLRYYVIYRRKARMALMPEVALTVSAISP